MGNSVTEYNSTHIVTDTDNIKKVAYGVNAAGMYCQCLVRSI